MSCCALQFVAVCCSVLQCVAVCCSVLQCGVVYAQWHVVAVKYVAVPCRTLQCVAVWRSVWQCVAVRCSVLQCGIVAECHRCSVLITQLHVAAVMCANFSIYCHFFLKSVLSFSN